MMCLLSMHISTTAQSKTQNLFIFGHSLIDHRPPINPTVPDETTVPHWMFLLAQEAGHTYRAGGQYGFLPQHQNTPPFAQWGYAIVPGVWDSDNVPWANADINSVFITAGNFIQYQAPTEDYFGDPGVTPVSATQAIIDFVGDKNIYIYENWPDMAGFLGNGWPATEGEYDQYNTYLRGEFHDWWLDYYNILDASRPNANLKMIPVGPIIADLTDGILMDVPVADLYEDDAPHGRPTLYFLASLISYMAIYEEPAPLDFVVPNSVHSEVADHYAEVVNFIWNELLTFTDGNGNNLVFVNEPQTGGAEHLLRLTENSSLYMEDDFGLILKGRDGNCYNLYVDEQGELQHELIDCPN